MKSRSDRLDHSRHEETAPMMVMKATSADEPRSIVGACGEAADASDVVVFV